jgi:hypothetical protein
MKLRSVLLRLALAISLVPMTACSTATTSGQLRTGMTPNETVQAMGEPDLKDNVDDPNHNGATVLRYTWIDSGKTAVFSSDDRVASIQNVDISARKQAEEVAAAKPRPPFDPINTPLNYLFFPVTAGFNYLGAGLNCVAGSYCRKPEITPPS